MKNVKPFILNLLLAFMSLTCICQTETALQGDLQLTEGSISLADYIQEYDIFANDIYTALQNMPYDELLGLKSMLSDEDVSIDDKLALCQTILGVTSSNINSFNQLTEQLDLLNSQENITFFNTYLSTGVFSEQLALQTEMMGLYFMLANNGSVNPPHYNGKNTIGQVQYATKGFWDSCSGTAVRTVFFGALKIAAGCGLGGPVSCVLGTISAVEGVVDLAIECG